MDFQTYNMLPETSRKKASNIAALSDNDLVQLWRVENDRAVKALLNAEIDRRGLRDRKGETPATNAQTKQWEWVEYSIMFYTGGVCIILSIVALLAGVAIVSSGDEVVLGVSSISGAAGLFFTGIMMQALSRAANDISRITKAQGRKR